MSLELTIPLNDTSTGRVVNKFPYCGSYQNNWEKVGIKAILPIKKNAKLTQVVLPQGWSVIDKAIDYNIKEYALRDSTKITLATYRVLKVFSFSHVEVRYFSEGEINNQKIRKEFKKLLKEYETLISDTIHWDQSRVVRVWKSLKKISKKHSQFADQMPKKRIACCLGLISNAMKIRDFGLYH